MTNSTKGLINLKAINSNIVFGNGDHLKATYVGNKKGCVHQKNGIQIPILLKKVKYVPKLACNLFSISTALQNGSIMEETSRMIKLKKGKNEYIFHHKLQSGKGNVYGICIIDKISDAAFLSMNEIHEMLGYPSEQITKATA